MPKSIRSILKLHIQIHMAYPDKTAYKIADEILSDIKKLLPEEKEHSENNKLSQWYKDGWNACLKEIERIFE